MGEEAQGCDYCGATFGIVILDHYPPEDFGGVEVFEELGAALRFVGCETAGRVLHGEEGVNGVADAGFGEESRIAWGVL